ncbi:TLDc domain-containing protein [Entamoeba marina]
MSFSPFCLPWVTLDTADSHFNSFHKLLNQQCRRWCFKKISPPSHAPSNFHHPFQLLLSLPLSPMPPQHSFTCFNKENDNTIRNDNVCFYRTSIGDNNLPTTVKPPFSTEWKSIINKGISLQQQREFLLQYTGANTFLLEHPDYYITKLTKSFGTYCPLDTILYFPPSFGGEFCFKEHPLKEKEALASVGFILSILSLNNPKVSFCPVLPNIVGILLTCCTLDETLAISNKLLSKSVKTNMYLPLHPIDFISFYEILIDQLKSILPKCIPLINSLDVNCFFPLISNFLVGYVPYSALYCILDQFMLVGMQAVLRYILSVAKISSKLLQLSENSQEFLAVLCYVMMAYPSPPHLINVGLKIPFSIQLQPPSQEKKTYLPLCLNTQSNILNYNLFEQLWQYIPRHKRILRPQLEYSSLIDGISFHNMKKRLNKKEPLLFVIQTEKKCIGFYLSHQLIQNPSNIYFGNGENFIFEVRDKEVYSFHWTMKNELFCCLKNDIMLIGGGGKHVGYSIALKKEFVVSSGISLTYDNPLLLDSFDTPILRLEVFCLV